MSLYRPDILLAIASVEEDFSTATLQSRHDHITGNFVGIHTVRRFIKKRTDLVHVDESPMSRRFRLSARQFDQVKADQDKVRAFYQFNEDDHERTTWFLSYDGIYTPSFVLELVSRLPGVCTRPDLLQAYDRELGTELKRQEIAREVRKLEKKPVSLKYKGATHRMGTFTKPSFYYELSDLGECVRKEHRHIMWNIYG